MSILFTKTSFPTLVSILAVVVGAAAVAPAAETTDPKALVRTVADAVLRDFPQPLAFYWREGVMLTGMMRAYHLTSDERYLAFVRNFADHWVETGIESTLTKRGYCGHWGPAFAVLMLYEETNQPQHLELANTVNRFMLKQAERTADGGLSHFDGKPQLWVDTLDMCCPVLSNTARICGRPKLQEEAIRQLEVFRVHLQDPATGLYYHMWDEKSAKLSSDEFWARGNGWVVMSYTEVLKNEKPGSKAYKQMADPFKKLLAGIVPLQDEKTGLWRTALDAPDTYLETSGSAMFLYGMAESRNLKLIDVPYTDVMRKAWAGLTTQISPEGRVTGVSGGTEPRGRDHYATRSVGTYAFGTGAFLLAACAWAESDLR